VSSTNINNTESGEVIRAVKLLKKAYRECKQEASDNRFNKKWTDTDNRHFEKAAKICVADGIRPEVYMELAFKNHIKQTGPWVNELWNDELVKKIRKEALEKLVLTRTNADGSKISIQVSPKEFSFAGQVSNIRLTLAKYLASDPEYDIINRVLLNPVFHFHPVAVYIVGHANEDVRNKVKQEAALELETDHGLIDVLQRLDYGNVVGELKSE
jgi:hypothetical protein